jgi:hypothetical protein
MKLPNKAQLNVFIHYALVVASVTPQILFAAGAAYPPAAVWAVAFQNMLSGFGLLQPGVVQAGMATIGAKGLRESEPKP